MGGAWDVNSGPSVRNLIGTCLARNKFTCLARPIRTCVIPGKYNLDVNRTSADRPRPPRGREVYAVFFVSPSVVNYMEMVMVGAWDRHFDSRTFQF